MTPALSPGRFVGDWFEDRLGPGQRHRHRVRRLLARVRTAYQDCAVADLEVWGRTLILDGELQSSAADEHIYHETLVHPALLAHPAPRRVLVMGGGEGAALREVLRHPSVETAVMADLDAEVLRLSREHLASWHAGAFDDPRARVLVEDARTALEAASRPWDVALSDLPSAARGGPAAALYTREFFASVRRRLAAGGVFAVQTGPASPLECGYHTALLRTLAAVFPVVRPCYVPIPSFDSVWSFALCSTTEPALGEARVDAELRRRGIRGLRFIDGRTVTGLFAAPKPLREAAARERRVVAGRRRVYLYS